MSKDIKAKILSSAAPVPLSVPEWGGVTVHVRNMNAMQRVLFEKVQPSADGVDDDDESANLDWFNRHAACLVAHTACDEKGERLFGDDEIEQLVDGAVDYEGLVRVYRKAREVNRMTGQAQDDVAKNS